MIQRPVLERWLTFVEARELLGVSHTMMYRLLREGALKGYKVGATWRFHLEDIAACKASNAERLQRAARKRTNKLDCIETRLDAQESPLISSCVVDTTQGRKALSGASTRGEKRHS